MVENAQGFVPVRRQPIEKPAEAGITGNRGEELIEPFLHDGREEWGRALPAAVELPYPVECHIDRRVVARAVSVRIANIPLSMNHEMLRARFHQHRERAIFHKTIFNSIASVTRHFARPRKDVFMRWSIRNGKLGISHERGLRTCCARDTWFVVGICRPTT